MREQRPPIHSERKKVHAEGPLYRVTSRGDGRGGVLTYFKGIRLYAETKKGPVEIRVGREGDWNQLLSWLSRPRVNLLKGGQSLLVAEQIRSRLQLFDCDRCPFGTYVWRWSIPFETRPP